MPRGHVCSRVVLVALTTLCLMLSVAVWAPGVVRAAAQSEVCTAGLPPELAAELEPLVQALSEATGQSGECATVTQAQDANQQQIRLLAEAMALLAMADPGYGYSTSSYASSPPSAVQAAAPASATPPVSAPGQASRPCDSPPDASSSAVGQRQ